MTCPVLPHHEGLKCGFRGYDCWDNLEEECCDQQATHKVGVEDSDPSFHNLTQYLCCTHLKQVMGRCP